MKFNTPYQRTTSKGEVNTLPSKTIPDQTMSIPELIRRYASGLPLGGQKVPMYEEDPEQDILGGQNWDTLDLSEKADIINNFSEELISHKKNQQEQKQKHKKKLQEELIEKEVQKRIKNKTEENQ